MPDVPASGPFQRASGLVAAVGLVCLALAALLSGTDRQSREFPNSPSVVGWPYDTGAARAKAALAFVRSGPASAIGYARRSILSDPISAQSVSILGRAELYAQHYTEAHKVFEVAGQLGWRDAMTQIYWLDQALLGNDYRVAAERLDALLRQSPDDENRDRFLAVVASSPEGRDALAQRLKLSPPWAFTIVTELRDLPDDQLMQRVDIMRRTGKGVWDCRASEKIAQRLIDLNKLDEAQSIWSMSCETSSSLVYDGGFEHLDVLKPTTGFDWVVSNRGDTEVAIAGDQAGDRSLELGVTAAVTLPVLRQLLVLNPGRYRLSWRTPGISANQAHALRVSLACWADLGQSVEGQPVDGKKDTWSGEFVVDDQCHARQLVFWLAPRSNIRLDDVVLTQIDKQKD